MEDLEWYVIWQHWETKDIETNKKFNSCLLNRKYLHFHSVMKLANDNIGKVMRIGLDTIYKFDGEEKMARIQEQE